MLLLLQDHKVQNKKGKKLDEADPSRSDNLEIWSLYGNLLDKLIELRKTVDGTYHALPIAPQPQ